MLKFISKATFSLHRVPGHEGIEGNERGMNWLKKRPETYNPYLHQHLQYQYQSYMLKQRQWTINLGAKGSTGQRLEDTFRRSIKHYQKTTQGEYTTVLAG